MLRHTDNILQGEHIFNMSENGKLFGEQKKNLIGENETQEEDYPPRSFCDFD